ncbi:hypothetical protein [Nocardioides sp.]|uniref:hypothetical protein n=1 Tax=Nocardioides sp. TaxID=35761 RepID=UPI002C5D5525|nr:hypothetical protein [Nocardioides sp.]HXH78680.1 hypothetical protein [Nocardioides sp.]
MTLSPRETTFVVPFYLNLMGENATWVGGEVWDGVVTVGRTATLDDVLWMLRVGAWRPVVMGAWLSLRFDRAAVGAAVLDALHKSAGSLTAPPLAVAAFIVVGDEAAAPALRKSMARSDEGSVGVLDAALEKLGADPGQSVSEESRASFSEMVVFGERLREALTGA